ncbi:MAG: DUF3150 domain-containing protein [Verrucomicrobia bacterium]|nr:MAG: DUF3150 domain-containing protein [Verrucomicrobiota bacterium]
MENHLLDAVCQKGVLVTTTIKYWRGCKLLKPEDLGLEASKVSDRLIRLGQKRLIPKDALSDFALIESRTHAMVEGASFPFLGGIARFVPNARLSEITNRLEQFRGEFLEATERFVEGYSLLRDKALVEWKEAAYQLPGNAEQLIATIEQSFPPAGNIAKRFSFQTQMFHISAPEGIRLEIANGVTDFEELESRRRIANEATRRMQNDLNAFIRESVASLRQETARLASDVLATIDGSEKGVHQRTLNRISSFIDSFRSLNFAGDQQLEQTLETFRTNLLRRSAEDYRNNPGAMTSLTDGLNRLRETAVQLAREDASDIVSRFGVVGQRRLAAVG